MLLDVLQQEKLEFLFRHWLAIEVALPLIAAAKAQLDYGVWADRRRAQLREMLEQQLADAKKRRTEAAQAFGKSQVLNKLSGRPAG